MFYQDKGQLINLNQARFVQLETGSLPHVRIKWPDNGIDTIISCESDKRAREIYGCIAAMVCGKEKRK